LRPSKKLIEKTLSEAEEKFNLKKDALIDVYREEARVVFLGKRRNIMKNLRKIVLDARKGGETVED